MLVLSRREGGKIKIGDNITLTVIEIRKDVVKLGFEAPKSVRILRGELIGKYPPPAETAETLWGNCELGGES